MDIVKYLGIDEGKICVINYGLSEYFYRPDEDDQIEARRNILLPSTPAVYILSVSTGSIYKNVAGSLKAFAQLVRSGRKDAFLVRVGVPLDRKCAALAHSLGVSDRIIELGTIPNSIMRYVYWQADALLFPSYYEGFGWPVIEAMACGVPVVTSSTPAVREATGGISAAFDPDDFVGMSQALVRLLEDPSERQTQVRQGEEWARSFTWKRAALQTAEVYDRLLSGHR
jgi:glycosyltransferase involved in cell wall biosynthesis